MITPVFMRKGYTLGKVNVCREMQSLFILSSLLTYIAKSMEDYMKGMIYCQRYKRGVVSLDIDVASVKQWNCKDLGPGRIKKSCYT